MTPLLKKFIQECPITVPDGVDSLPLTRIFLFTSILTCNPPILYENFDSSIYADVGYSWLKANLSDEEFAEFIAMKLRGQVT